MATRMPPARFVARNFAIPILIALIQFVVEVRAHDNYGYFRDELYYIACSKHLAFGYVDAPPLSLAILALNRCILGDSLQAMRFLPWLAGAAVVVPAALMARCMGGGRFARGIARVRSLCTSLSCRDLSHVFV